MNYISTKELSEKWGVNQSRVLKLAREGRIEGARLFGNNWMFPAGAEKPADGRTKSAKAAKQTKDYFRFPLYVNFNEKDYIPPLSEEEKILREAQKMFYACRFEEAKKLLSSLDGAENRYVRLSAYYHRLYIAIYDNSLDYYDSILQKIDSELSQDFPYKTEMSLLRYGFDEDDISFRSVLENFQFDPEYSYHPSVYYVLALLSFIPIEKGDFSLMSLLRYDTQELLCRIMECEGYYLEAQKMHFMLMGVNQRQNNTKKMEYHIRRGLEIAMEHDLYFIAAFYEWWYRSAVKNVLRSFPPDFSEKIQTLGNLIQNSQARFEKLHEKPYYISSLSGKEFEYGFLATQGYTNREVAQMMKVSEKTVSKIYGAIYDKLGVRSKHDLVDIINGTSQNIVKQEKI